MTLRRAAAAEIAAVARLIAAHPMQLLQQDEGWLNGIAADPAHRVMVWHTGTGTGKGTGKGGITGFAVMEMAYPRVVNLINLGLARPGSGEGAALIRAALDEAFGPMAAHRLFCDIAHDNAPALRAFARAGLVQEGTMRQCWLRAGRWEDCHSFAILRDEWQKATEARG